MYSLFLNDQNLSKSIFRLIEESKELRIAVPYWGSEHIDKIIGRENAGKTQIICQLSHGATDPSAIEKLLDKFGRDNVKQLDNLHAKFYLDVNQAAILTSANFSANALGHTGNEIINLHEIGMKVYEQNQLDLIDGYFKTLFKESRKITKKDLEEATQRYIKNRAGRPYIKHKNTELPSLSYLLRKNPRELSDRLFFAVYTYVSNLDREDLKIKSDISRQEDNTMTEIKQPILDFWEDWKGMPEELYHIGVKISKNHNHYINGLYVLPKNANIYRVKKKNSEEKVEIQFVSKFTSIKDKFGTPICEFQPNDKIFLKDLFKYLYRTKSTDVNGKSLLENINDDDDDVTYAFIIHFDRLINNDYVQKFIESYDFDQS